MDNLREQFGDSLELTDEFKWEWISIPHIYRVPFYTYAYSFGQLLVLALYRQYQQEGEPFVPRYLKLLSYGGSEEPVKVLEEAGFDVASPEFWQGGFDVLSENDHDIGRAVGMGVEKVPVWSQLIEMDYECDTKHLSLFLAAWETLSLVIPGVRQKTSATETYLRLSRKRAALCRLVARYHGWSGGGLPPVADRKRRIPLSTRTIPPIRCMWCSVGWIAIVLHSADGRELVLAEMRPGSVFGENALITGSPRSAGAVAHETTELVSITGDAFLSALDTEPLLARHLLELAARRLSEGNERERALAFLNAGARIARILLTLDEMDQRTADKGYVTISQDELAQRTGLTRQTVARFLGDWRRRNYLLTGRGRIMLLQRTALQDLEEQNYHLGRPSPQFLACVAFVTDIVSGLSW